MRKSLAAFFLGVFSTLMLVHCHVVHAQNVPVSQFPTATLPLAGSELVPLVQGGKNVSTAASNVGTTNASSLTAGTLACPRLPSFTGAITSSGCVTTFALATTGSGNFVLSTSPVLVTPALGTPSSVNLANATNLPATALAAGTNGTGPFVLTTSSGLIAPSLGTPTAVNLANATNLPSSAFAAGVTGAGAVVLASSASLVNANLNIPSFIDLTNAINVPSASLAPIAPYSVLGNPTGSQAVPIAETSLTIQNLIMGTITQTAPSWGTNGLIVSGTGTQTLTDTTPSDSATTLAGWALPVFNFTCGSGTCTASDLDEFYIPAPTNTGGTWASPALYSLHLGGGLRIDGALSLGSALSPALTVSSGGTGLATAATGVIEYGTGSTTALTALAGNTTTQPQVLCQTGTGSASAAPAWCNFSSILAQSGIPMVLPPSGYMDATGNIVFGQSPPSGATMYLSSSTAGSGITITFNAATLTGTAAGDTGRVITINDTGTSPVYKIFTITGNSGASTTIAQGTLATTLTPRAARARRARSPRCGCRAQIRPPTRQAPGQSPIPRP